MIYLCRWQNGDFSIIEAVSEEDAIEGLDEVANADGMPLYEMEDLSFLMTFHLDDSGDFVLESVGESTCNVFWDKMYPKLYAAVDKDDEKRRTAVTKERKRVKARKVALPTTEAAKDLQRLTDLPTSLANKHIARSTKETLKKAQTKGKPQ